MRRVWEIALLILLTRMTTTALAQQCTSGSAPNLNLGTYTGAVSTTGAAPGTVNCFSGTTYTIGFGNGTGVGATQTIRKMTKGSATLNYELFRDSATTLNWGNIGGSQVLSATGTGATQTYTVYPLIPAGQNVPSGTYVDTVSATISDNGTFSQNFTVTATVSTACSMSVGNLSFGVYTGAQKDVTAAIAVTCTNGTPYYVNLNNGTNSTCCWFERMTGPGGQLLTYADYRDSARTSQWGNTVNSDGVAGTGSGSVQTLTLYSRVFGGAYVTPGVYSDTLIATITY